MSILRKKYFFVSLLVIIAITGISMVWIFGPKVGPQPITQTTSPPPVVPPADFAPSSIRQESTSTSGPETYRNTDWGFEFQYPKGWTFHPNTFGSAFSKFNLVGASPEENGIPNPLISSILVNIVTRNFSGRGADDQNVSDITVDGILGQRYEFRDEGGLEIGVDLPFGQYHMLLGAIKKHEPVFNQILATFKFLK